VKGYSGEQEIPILIELGLTFSFFLSSGLPLTKI
jgi:hypothetical protein